MSYLDSTLLTDERIVYRARLHVIIYWQAILLSSIGVIAIVLSPPIGGLILLAGLLLFIEPTIRRQTSEFGVTDKRLVIKVGFLRRRTLELLLRQVEAISVDQSVAGRLLDFGTVTITGTGGVREVFAHVAAPLELRRRIQGQTA